MNVRLTRSLMILVAMPVLLSACGGSGNSENAVKACMYTREAIGSLDTFNKLAHSESAAKYAARAADENSSRYAILESAGTAVYARTGDYSGNSGWDFLLMGALLEMNAVCVDLGEPQYN